MVKSPCVKICKMAKKKDSEEKFCLGCGRTKDEIKGWKNYTEEEKEAVLERLRVE